MGLAILVYIALGQGDIALTLGWYIYQYCPTKHYIFCYYTCKQFVIQINILLIDYFGIVILIMDGAVGFYRVLFLLYRLHV